ncbi:MAG: DUF1579 family protein [bacterium]
MRRLSIALFAMLVIIAMPLMAQEKEAAQEKQAMAPPEPLADEWSKWMVGEWKGWSESEQGKSKDWQKVELGLDGQFVMFQATSAIGEMTYKGMGALTHNPETGESMGYWIDNWRGMYAGKGKREGNKLTMEWKGYMGTYNETIEKVSDDKFVTTYSFTDPQGNTSQGRGEMTRVKPVTEKE